MQIGEKELKLVDTSHSRKDQISLENYNTNLKFDIIYFDAFSPEKQPELWKENIFQKMNTFF